MCFKGRHIHQLTGVAGLAGGLRWWWGRVRIWAILLPYGSNVSGLAGSGEGRNERSRFREGEDPHGTLY